MDREALQRRHAERARERRRRHRRRRATGVGALLAVVAVIVAVVAVALTGGGGSHHARAVAGRSASRKGATASSDRHAAGSHPTVAGLVSLGPGTGRPGHATVPILMYHVIAPPPTGAPFPGLYVPEPEFAAQMHALRAAGWHAVTLDEVRANWRDGVRLPAKPIVITFDNGYHSQYADALPVLRRMDWAADENLQLTGLPPAQGGMTTGEVRALIRAGWELDTQGISHADLVTLDAAQLHAQVAGARRTLQHRYHVPVNWFCYPSGQYDPTVVAAVKAAGFVGSTTVVPGWAQPADSPDALPRLRVLGGTTPAGLLAQIASARSASPPPAADESDTAGT